MSKIKYINKKFGAEALAVIAKANQIIADYTAQGFDLTLRQLYYQFVGRDLIENNEKSYKRLGSIIDDGRLSGLIDWSAILDRTRKVQSNPHWTSPAEIVSSCASQFRLDLWLHQPVRVECWIEKDALTGVIAGVCEGNDVPYFACRGYSSQSAMWRSAMRARENDDSHNQRTVILYLGDHDPSGIDMTRDVKDRMALLSGNARIIVERLALNIDQVKQYHLPPNFAKLTDARADDYIAKFGESSWELDALEPSVLVHLIQIAIDKWRDEDEWEKSVKGQRAAIRRLTKIAKQLKKDEEK